MYLGNFQPVQNRDQRVRRNVSILRSVPLQKNPELRSGYSYFLPDIKQLYRRLFNDRDELIQFEKILPFRPMKTEPTSCNKYVTTKDISYRCFDCLIHQGSMICQKCFKQGDHKYHRYRQIKQQGCCDCGNERILNSSGFCSSHKPAQKLSQKPKIVIPIEKRVVFQLYIKQLFIWGLKLWSSIDVNNGTRFFYHLLKYLSQLNKESPYYNQLTVNLLFAGSISIMSQIIQLGLTPSSFKDQVNTVIFDLMNNLMPCNEFKQKILPLFINLYNTINRFQNSNFGKFLVVLLSDSMLVENVMKNAQQTLNPTRIDYNITGYYEYLMLIRFLKPLAIQRFFAPLLKKSIILSPFLQKIEENCEQRNSKDYFLSTLTENTQQEFLYYRLLSMIIGSISDKQLLRMIIFNYAKKITQCKFRINKIVLIPQRIFILALFKYFDFQIDKVDLNELKEILKLDAKDINQFLCNFIHQVLNCLGEYALDLVRNTYFYNYRSIYVKEESQVVMIDYLSIKILASLFFNNNQTDSFIHILQEYTKKSINSANSSVEIKKDNFDLWNKMVQIFMEIIYSPKVEIINSIFLNNTQRIEKVIANLLARVVKTRGKINQNQFDSLIKSFFFDRSLNEIILQIVSLNKNTSKYEITQGSIYAESQEINFSILVSLTRTELHNFITTQRQVGIKLQKEQIWLRNILLSPLFVQELLKMQCYSVVNLPVNQFGSNIIQLTKVTAKINKFFDSNSQIAAQYLQQYRRLIIQIIQNEEIINQPSNTQLSSVLKNIKIEFQGIVGNVFKKEQRQDEQLKKRKALAKAKKERLIKDRKMMENRQIYLGKEQLKKEELKQKQNEDCQECLVCKQKERSSKLCYFAKVKFNNVLVNLFDKNTKHLMFYSCFHMVHMECFLKHNLSTTSFSCPLCHAACNIVLPHQQGYSQILPLFSLLLQNIKKSLNYQPKNVTLEIIIFLAYVNLVNIQKQSLPQRQVRLCRSLYQFVCFNYSQKQKQDKIRPTNILGKCILLMQELIQLAAGETAYMVCEELVLHDHAARIFYQLSQCLSKFLAYRVVTNIIRVVNPSILRLFDWGSQIKYQPSQKIIKLNQLPKNMIELVLLRDQCKCKKDFNHSIAICVICSQKVCQQCIQMRNHSQKFHLNECIYFKTNTGGFVYDHNSIELQIRSFFVNQLGKIWKPQYSLKQFELDQPLFDKLCSAIKSGNLFYFLSHTFEGLKNKNLDDII